MKKSMLLVAFLIGAAIQFSNAQTVALPDGTVLESGATYTGINEELTGFDSLLVQTSVGNVLILVSYVNGKADGIAMVDLIELALASMDTLTEGELTVQIDMNLLKANMDMAITFEGDVLLPFPIVSTQTGEEIDRIKVSFFDRGKPKYAIRHDGYVRDLPKEHFLSIQGSEVYFDWLPLVKEGGVVEFNWAPFMDGQLLSQWEAVRMKPGEWTEITVLDETVELMLLKE